MFLLYNIYLIHFSKGGATVVCSRPPASENEQDDRAVEAKFFRTLGHPLRLQVLEHLGGAGELTVGELQERLEIAQSHLSNHLSCLRNCGLVITRAEGRRIFYRLADPAVLEIRRLAQAISGPRARKIACCRHQR